MGHAKLYEKHTRGVHKSHENNNTPIPEGTTEYAPNTAYGYTNHRKTMVHQYHEARQNMRKTQLRGALITEKR